MRVMVALPPHAYATADVAQGYLRALARVPGVHVEPWHFWSRIAYHDGAARAWGAAQRKAARADGAVVKRNDYRLHRNIVLLKASGEIVNDALHASVDWVLVVCGVAFHPDTVRQLRRGGVRVAAAFTESPYEDHQARHFGHAVDLLGVNDRASLATFPAASTIYLPTAYDREVHRPDVLPDKDSPDVLFLGTGFAERVRLMAGVDWSGIDLRLRGHWRKGARNPLLRPYITGDDGVMITRNELTASLYRAARINLNLYRRDGMAQSMSPRAYELAALGAFALHEDARPETREVFGDSVGYFDNAATLEAAVRHYLARPGERARMAREAQERVQGQDYDARARTLLDAMDRRQWELTRHNDIA